MLEEGYGVLFTKELANKNPWASLLFEHSVASRRDSVAEEGRAARHCPGLLVRKIGGMEPQPVQRGGKPTEKTTTSYRRTSSRPTWSTGPNGLMEIRVNTASACAEIISRGRTARTGGRCGGRLNELV